MLFIFNVINFYYILKIGILIFKKCCYINLNFNIKFFVSLNYKFFYSKVSIKIKLDY